ncbi:MAG: hypothetical protein Q8P18_03970 [Pseudomonadota bacterium]|nr:hypothetical protein [Pseudomonadota bacterium]
MLTSIALSLALSGAFSAASAAEPETTILVSSLQPRNAEATGLASLVENFLAQELKDHPGFDVLRVEDTPAFEDYAARTYMDGCPRGEVVGCTQIIGERGKAAFAVTGTVLAVVGGTQVQIEILDIRNGRSLIRFESELESGADEAFAEGVAKVLAAAIDGEIGKERDIRFDGEDAPEPMDDVEVRKQLDELQREMGSVTAVISRSDRVIERPAYSLEDLSKKMEGEGTKPWERLDMKPAEYLRYKNSGLELFQWRERAVGRKGQLLLRPTVGFSNGPYSGLYYSRSAYDVPSGTLTIVDVYAAQAVQTGSGANFGGSVGFGISPVVDVGATIGVTTGSWTVDIGQETVGQPASASQPYSTGQTTLVVGPRVTATLFPVLPIRPTFGGSVLLLRGRTEMDPDSVPEGLVFEPAVMIAAELFVGGEARISRSVDFFLHVPLQVRLAGEVVSTFRDGIQEEVDAAVPRGAGIIGAGVAAGLQIRLFGAKVKESSRFDDMDEPEEE